MLHTIQRITANWMVHILHRNCILNTVTKGKTDGSVGVMGRRGRQRKQLLDDLKERRRYCKLKDDALNHTVCVNRFGRSCGPLLRHAT